MPREIIEQLEQQGAAIAASRPDLTGSISPAQRRVLDGLLGGLTEPQIAERIERSRHTVHDHTRAIYTALGVNSRVQLVLLFSQPRTTPAGDPAAAHTS